MREPFFLLKHSSSCQEVMGMRFTEEWVFWDCEDKENKNVAVSYTHLTLPTNREV